MPNIIPSRSGDAIAIEKIRRFTVAHMEFLTEASLILGGPAAQRRFMRLVSRLQQASSFDPNLLRELSWMRGLLTLDHVDDPHATDPVHFCDIQPDDPVVCDLCLVADAMTDLLSALSRTPRDRLFFRPANEDYDAA